MRPLLLVAVAVAIALPAAADARVVARIHGGMAGSEGPEGAGATAFGSAGSVGLALGAPWLSAVAELGFRRASISTERWEGGLGTFRERHLIWSLGLRSEVPLAEAWGLGLELHGGGSGADLYVFDEEAARYLEEQNRSMTFGFAGGAIEGLWTSGPWEVGLRATLDRFAPFSGTYEDDRLHYEHLVWTIGPVVGRRFD